MSSRTAAPTDLKDPEVTQQNLPKGETWDENEPERTEGKTSNPKFGVGGTSKDGGMSTADTVADGGQDAPEEDGEYKPE
ncbi:hypothetical protein N431DRAFT_460721 [Stipitochalara longipes BDJ]|nr:hypothetical protein N431DRAFT_460721 [Stipitochalara longipes BDJ]